MRTKDDPQIFDPKCPCGRPLERIYYHRPCNLVFCGLCIGSHVCKPGGSESRPESPVLLPDSPGAGDEGNCFHFKHTSGNGHNGSKLKRKRKR